VNFYRSLLILILLLLVACDNNGRESTAVQNPGSEQDTIPTPTEQVIEGGEMEVAPTDEPASTPLSAAEPQDVSIEAADGLLIKGTFYPAQGQGPWPGVILLHMNGRQREDWDDFARLLAANGYAALAIDMRGHGETGGSRDWEQAPDDLERVWRYLTGREDIDADRTAVAGASIGANMALVLGDNAPDINTIILLSPGLDYFGVTTDDRIESYGERPVLIAASEEDAEAAESSRTLVELASGPVELIMYDGAGHGTNMFAHQPDLSEQMLAWLDTYVKGEATAAGGELPAPNLFDIDWDDREVFRDGLIDAEAGVLDEMSGASIYHLDLTVSPDLRHIAGQQEVRYTNQENVPLEEVYFHLFPNLLGGDISVDNLAVNGQPIEPEYILNQVLDELDSDRTREVATMIRVPLDEALAPGEQVVISLDYRVLVPAEGGSNYGVFATIDDVMALAHFYPQIAVYDDAGWQIDVPPPNADVTYADSSYYLVRLTAPDGQVTVTSGNLLDESEKGDLQTSVYAAGPVRDFYIASSDRYTVVSDMLGETRVNSYGFAEFSEQNQRALEVAIAALESMGNRLGTYPFTEFDIAPTPNLALGVEYPGVIVIRSALYDPDATLGNTPAPFYAESTTAHEVGHQWFYSVVGNNQLTEPWLDESLTQYITYLYYVDTYDPQAAAAFRESFVDRWGRVEGEDIPIGMPAGNYQGSEYSAIVYGRGPLFFEALSQEMGEDTFNAFLRDYYQQNKWGIATGAELKALAEEHCGCDLSGLFAEWVGDQ
jgi:dienelactone hydrolase